MERSFKDKHGRLLEVVEESRHGTDYVEIKFGKGVVAYVRYRNEGDVLKLVDLLVKNEFPIRQTNYLKRLFGQQMMKINFRGQGIGTRLLNHVIEHARKNGFNRIEGDMATVDLGPKFDLPAWYQKHGFQVDGFKVWMVLK